MTTPMRSLLKEVSRAYFPCPPATTEDIEEFERRVNWKLDPDLRAFYLHCDGASLIRWQDSPYEILPLSKIVRARVSIRGVDDDSRGPASMYSLCYVRDGNYVVLDVSRQVDGNYPLIDGDRETWPNPEYCTQIAGSFSGFLEQVLRTKRSLYWLGKEVSKCLGESMLWESQWNSWSARLDGQMAIAQLFALEGGRADAMYSASGLTVIPQARELFNTTASGARQVSDEACWVT